MRTEDITVTSFRIYDAPRLDPIIVIVEEATNSGSITITCYGLAWTAYFGACGDIWEFLVECNPEYLESKLSRKYATKREYEFERKYVVRIITAVQEAIQERI